MKDPLTRRFIRNMRKDEKLLYEQVLKVFCLSEIAKAGLLFQREQEADAGEDEDLEL